MLTATEIIAEKKNRKATRCIISLNKANNASQNEEYFIIQLRDFYCL